MSKRLHIKLTKNERQELEQLVSKGESSARVQRRARVLLLSDRNQAEPLGTSEIAKALMCSPATVCNVKRRYLSGGLPEALHDKPRPGAIPKITGDVEAHLVALTCSDPPDGYGRWTLRLLADQLVELGVVESISHVAVGEVLKKTNSSPGA
jgi:transposase